jgi:hypothetical protein
VSERENMNLHLGDALNHIEKALSANQGLRGELLRDAVEILEFVKREECNGEL